MKDLRPITFDQYIGQSKMKDKLKILINASIARKDALDHILLHGPPGLGKTTLARVIANMLNTNIRVTSAPILEKVGDIAAILMSMKDNEILFIDEIHRLNRSVEEMLYPAIEDRCIDILIGKGPTAKSVRIKLKKFTLIGATTNASLLSAPFRDRFGFTHRLERYSDDDLSKIIEKNSALLGMYIDINISQEIAKISRGTPRIANRFLRRIRDYVEVKKIDKIDSNTIKLVLKMLDIDSLGLDSLDREILKTIYSKYKGGPVGVGAIASSLGEDRKNIEEVNEPYLVKQGLIERTKKGRVLTKKGFNHLEGLDEDI